jgi:hypothetical protein
MSRRYEEAEIEEALSHLSQADCAQCCERMEHHRDVLRQLLRSRFTASVPRHIYDNDEFLDESLRLVAVRARSRKAAGTVSSWFFRIAQQLLRAKLNSLALSLDSRRGCDDSSRDRDRCVPRKPSSAASASDITSFRNYLRSRVDEATLDFLDIVIEGGNDRTH